MAEHILQLQWDILNGAAGPAGQVKTAIWLGKQYLGQSERPAVEHPGGLSVTVNITAYRTDHPPTPPDNSVRHVDAKRVDPPMLEGEVIEQQAGPEPSGGVAWLKSPPGSARYSVVRGLAAAARPRFVPSAWRALGMSRQRSTAARPRRVRCGHTAWIGSE